MGTETDITPPGLRYVAPSWWAQLFDGRLWRVALAELPFAVSADAFRAMAYRRAEQCKVTVRVSLDRDLQLVYLQVLQERWMAMNLLSGALPAPPVPNLQRSYGALQTAGIDATVQLVADEVARAQAFVPASGAGISTTVRLQQYLQSTDRLLEALQHITKWVEQVRTQGEQLARMYGLPPSQQAARDGVRDKEAREREEHARSIGWIPRGDESPVRYPAPARPAPSPADLTLGPVYANANPAPAPAPVPVQAPRAYADMSEEEQLAFEAAEIMVRCTCGTSDVNQHPADCGVWGL